MGTTAVATAPRAVQSSRARRPEWNRPVSVYVSFCRMLRSRLAYILFALAYLALCTIGGIFLADAALHPMRRPITENSMSPEPAGADPHVTDVSVTTRDRVTLRGWLMTPPHSNKNAVLLLHGLGDNRVGMVGYAKLFLAHGYTVLLPDARAHGDSGGEFATYGLLERNDIHLWMDFLAHQLHPDCIYGLGESMGAAQLLQSLGTPSQFCAVVAESPFADFREIAYDRMGQPFHAGPWLGRTLLRPVVEVAFLRARWKYGFDMRKVSPEKSLDGNNTPVLLIHGQLDSNIPVRHSRLIHAADPATQVWEVPGANHCGAYSADPGGFEQRVLAFFAAHADLTGVPIRNAPLTTRNSELATRNSQLTTRAPDL
jgi:uncharacterized protein